MLEILYRIYQVNDVKLTEEQIQNDEYAYETYSNLKSTELAMECLICESRDKFKEIIKDLYGKNIRFTYSKKLDPGDVYCVIIGEHCWNKDKYFTRYDFECDCCHTKFHSYINQPIKFDSYEIEWDLLGQGAKVTGYIYKITKKSTGEFYIGQTIYEPMFRWAQHLATDRFKIDNILDYQYETIEVVPYGENILEREKYWIQKYYKENPKLSLNIMQTAGLDQISFDEIKEGE